MEAKSSPEWVGIQQFPAATHSKLLELLRRLKQENVSTVTILVMGKGGVGKSSTVNSLLGERAVPVGAFQPHGLKPIMSSRTHAGFTLNIVDTAGLVDGGYINLQALKVVKRFLLNKTIDILCYVDRLDTYRVDSLDRQVIKAITDAFGQGIWRRSMVVLTHAQLSPPEGLSYDEFFARRSGALLKSIRLGTRIKKHEFEQSPIPVILVENNQGREVNDNGEKVLPDGTTTIWTPKVVEAITNLFTNGSKPIMVDQQLIDGPNPNKRGKFFIPLILAFQLFVVVSGIERAIRDDMAKQSKPLWELRDMVFEDETF